MTETIIFINGYGVPLFAGKYKLLWNDPMWSDYNCIYNKSVTPTSDDVIEKELCRLEKLIDSFKHPIVAGHSLGAWWTANLVLRQNVRIEKAVYFTPLADTTKYPNIFSAPDKYCPLYSRFPPECCGPKKNLVLYADKDLIATIDQAKNLSIKLEIESFVLYGYH